MARTASHRANTSSARLTGLVTRLPPTSFFLTSALFHYLGPALAVLLFAHLAPLGVMWLRIASAAAVFAIWRRPWQIVARLDTRQRMLLVALGGLLAAMNSLFYLAVARLPLATVGAIEFLGTVALVTLGVRTWRNLGALVVTVGGVSLLTVFKAASDPLGFVFAFGNCVGFFGYLVIGHRIANVKAAAPGRRSQGLAGIDQLGASMILAAIVATPIGLPAALPVLEQPSWLLWGVGVGICSSVIPYVTDQLAMARLPRATFALMLALLPACATLIGLVVLRQIPTAEDLGGIGLVVAGLVIHQPSKSEPRAGRRPPRASDSVGPGPTKEHNSATATQAEVQFRRTRERDHSALRAEWSACAAAVDTVLRVDVGRPRRLQQGR